MNLVIITPESTPLLKVVKVTSLSLPKRLPFSEFVFVLDFHLRLLPSLLFSEFGRFRRINQIQIQIHYKLVLTLKKSHT